MPFLDRDSFIGLLDKLGDPDDAAALAAAREIHQRMQDAGIGWADLLVPADGGRADRIDADDDPLDVTDPSQAVEETSNSDDHLQPIADTGEDVARIDRLLALPDLTPTTRAELNDYKLDIAEGEFTELDRRYLIQLETRLTSGRKSKG